MPYKLPAMKRKTLDPITPCDADLTPIQWLDKHTGEDLIIALARFALTFHFSDILASELYLNWAGYSADDFDWQMTPALPGRN